MLVRTDLLKPADGLNPRYVALLRSPSDSETLLRVAAYPDRGFIYCGLWWEEDLLLGWREAALIQNGDRTFANCVVDVVGRADISVRLEATWEHSSESSEICVLSADAQLLDPDGAVIDRLALSPVNRFTPKGEAGRQGAFPALRLIKGSGKLVAPNVAISKPADQHVQQLEAKRDEGDQDQ